MKVRGRGRAFGNFLDPFAIERASRYDRPRLDLVTFVTLAQAWLAYVGDGEGFVVAQALVGLALRVGDQRSFGLHIWQEMIQRLHVRTEEDT